MAVPIASKWHRLRRFRRKDITRNRSEVHATRSACLGRHDRQTVPSGSEEPFAKNAIAENRHNHWLIDLGTDVDAAVIAGMLNPDALKMTAAMKTADFDGSPTITTPSAARRASLIRWDHEHRGVVSLDRWRHVRPLTDPGEHDVRPATVSRSRRKAWGHTPTARLGANVLTLQDGHRVRRVR